mmetsp:Transcript_7911/g.19469  ORF Transcript_7911/g.19469 Transcript_7911/m.19469 type:complete len:746 (+) Transcript_7911:559-2796(+)
MSAATAMQMMSAMQMPGAEPHAIRHTTYPMSAYNAKSHEVVSVPMGFTSPHPSLPPHPLSEPSSLTASHIHSPAHPHGPQVDDRPLEGPTSPPFHASMAAVGVAAGGATHTPLHSSSNLSAAGGVGGVGGVGQPHKFKYPLSMSDLNEAAFLKNDDVDRTCTSLMMLIPNHTVGWLIGAKGQCIAEIERMSAAEVKVQSEAEIMPNFSERKLTIFGTIVAIQRCQHLISQQVRNKTMGSAANFPNQPTILKLVVPNGCVKYIIGKRGDNIKAVQHESGAHIDIESEGEMLPSLGGRRILITGTPAGCTTAQYLISRHSRVFTTPTTVGTSPTAAGGAGVFASGGASPAAHATPTALSKPGHPHPFFPSPLPMPTSHMAAPSQQQQQHMSVGYTAYALGPPHQSLPPMMAAAASQPYQATPDFMQGEPLEPGYGQSMAQQYPGTPLAAAGGPYAASLRGYYPPGAQEAVAAAGYSRPVEMLASGTPSPPSDSSLTMTEFVVPGDAVARIIGSRGNTVREIQEMSGTKIDVINDAPASAPHRRLTIKGSLSAIHHAKKLIETKINAPIVASGNMSGAFPAVGMQVAGGVAYGGAQLYPPQTAGYDGYGGAGSATSDGTCVRVVPVPDQHVARLIGSKGHQVEDLQKSSGTNIHIDRRDATQDQPPGTRTCTVKGSAEGVEQACALIQQKLDSFERQDQALAQQPPPGAAHPLYQQQQQQQAAPQQQVTANGYVVPQPTQQQAQGWSE